VTYGIFLAIFLVVPLSLVVVLARRLIDRRLALVLAVLVAVAVAYTGPWDSAIIANGVWSYGPRQVVGAVAGGVPIEEIIFYVLQVCLTGIFTAFLWHRYGTIR
jgi:lycopene cyclase domain-containing protein